MTARIRFDEWLKEFARDKRLVATFQQSDTFAVYDIRRYGNLERSLWEIAYTYTDRLVMRSGKIRDDGVNVDWSEWQTLHEVEVPKKS